MRIYKKTSFHLIISLLGIFLFTSCKNEMWVEHYKVDSNIASDKNAWEIINKNPKLSKFIWAIKRTGYDKMLSSSQMFTVWAPDDASVDNIDTTNTSISNDVLLKQFVQNHIAKYSYSASGNNVQKVIMLNNKILMFSSKGNDFYIGNNLLKERNFYASNGIIHIIENQIPFFGNIWELLSVNQSIESLKYDSLRAYMYLYNKIIFDPKNSIPGDVNADGNMVYLDSVLINYNTLFYKMGQLSTEDSTYHVVFSNNQAWKEAYSRIKDFYIFRSTILTKYTADTLQRNKTLRALTKDLVFRTQKQNMNGDSLISTSQNKFYRPFDGAINQIPVSNGKVYIVDKLKYKPWESWHKVIRVEAEGIIGRESLLGNLYERDYSALDYLISNQKYIDVIPQNSSADPSVSFEIPNTLSGKLNADSTIMYGAAYNIYCVFAPSIFKSSTPKPSKVYFKLNYMLANGKQGSTVFNNKSNCFVTKTDQITKVLVAKKVVFPFCEDGFKNPNVNVKLTVLSSVTDTEKETYMKDMLIDCIILEPVQQ